MAKAMKAMKAVKAMPSSAMFATIGQESELKPKVVKRVFGALSSLAEKEVGKTGKFTIPGVVMLKLKVKPARPASKKMMFGKMVNVKASKAKKVVKAFAVKALKDSI